MLIVALLGTVMTLYGFRFGRDTGCAMLATMLALKPVEMRSLRDARSLLGFALFAPFATFLLDQGPLSLSLGLAGAVAALTALHTLSEIESDARAPARRPWARLTMVARMIAIGLPLAMVVFWLFPRFTSPLWGGARTRAGQARVVRPDVAGRLDRPDRRRHPGAARDLLRRSARAVADVLARPRTVGFRWPHLDLGGLVAGDQPRPHPPRPGAGVYDYEMEIEPTDRSQLVALEMPLAAPEGAHLYGDYSLVSRQTLNALTRWRLRSAPQTALAETDLHPMLRSLALRLPPGYNPRTQALAERWRLEAGPSNRTTDDAIVRRALAWIRAEFVYTLDTPLLGRDSVDEFLFDQKAGFCEHYSSAFVVLMRGAGIPARVVTGYVGGYRNPVGGYWLVRRSDAHAWAEVWIEAAAGCAWTPPPPSRRNASTTPLTTAAPARSARSRASARCSTSATGCGAAGTTSCSATTRAGSATCCNPSASPISTPARWSACS